jgi:hypothetical protein
MENVLGNAYLESMIKRFASYKELGDKTFAQIRDADFHFRPNEESNSIAVIVHHMSGNMLSRWTGFLTEDGEKTWRKRDTEFEFREDSRDEVIAAWEKGWSCLLSALGSLTAADLLSKVKIRSESLLALDAINRQLAHYAYHVGQIIYLGKVLRNDEWKSLSIPRGQSKTHYPASPGNRPS